MCHCGYRPPRLELVRRATNRSEEHTSELQSQSNLVCRLLLEKKKRSIPLDIPVVPIAGTRGHVAPDLFAATEPLLSYHRRCLASQQRQRAILHDRINDSTTYP